MSKATPITYSIGELAQEFDITTRSIRFYEDQGLIHPTRKGQTRIYNHRDKVRLKLILRGKRLNFSLAEIGQIFGKLIHRALFYPALASHWPEFAADQIGAQLNI